MAISVIIPCGYFSNSDLENDRLIKFTKQLESFQYIDFGINDELVFIEQSPNIRLCVLISDFVEKLNCKKTYSYLKPREEDQGFFNQSLCKNEGIKIAKNENLLFINSDIILKYLNDMEKGINISKGSTKGARSYSRLNSLKSIN